MLWLRRGRTDLDRHAQHRFHLARLSGSSRVIRIFIRLQADYLCRGCDKTASDNYFNCAKLWHRQTLVVDAPDTCS